LKKKKKRRRKGKNPKQEKNKIKTNKKKNHFFARIGLTPNNLKLNSFFIQEKRRRESVGIGNKKRVLYCIFGL